MAEIFFASFAEKAASVSQTIFDAKLDPSQNAAYRTALNVAVRLHLINTYIKSLPPWWIEKDIEKLCRELQQVLESIEQPDVKQRFWFPSTSSRDPVARLKSFFVKRTSDAETLETICDELHARLNPDNDDTEGHRIPDAAFQHFESADHSAFIHEDVYKVLKIISECIGCSGGSISTNSHASETLRHPTKLCLHETSLYTTFPQFSTRILASPMDMGYWQQFHLRVRSRADHPFKTARRLKERGGLCQFLETDLTACLFLSFQEDQSLALLETTESPEQIPEPGNGQSLASVLRSYELTPKDKVVLAHAIARAYWLYYDSELMRTKWSSESIWFMPEKDNRDHKGQLPLCAYLSFPFNAPGWSSNERLEEEMLIHRYPRIFDIAIILLEIGLCNPFRPSRKRGLVAECNFNHKIANDELWKLQSTSWDGFANKQHFDKAVEFCLNGRNFTRISKQVKTVQQDFMTTAASSAPDDGPHAIEFRKKAFHKNVVQPLAWLAEEGYKAKSGDVTYVRRQRQSQTSSAFAETVSRLEADLFSQIPSEPLFHGVSASQMWLENLKTISTYVERQRRKQQAVTNHGKSQEPRIRVAILDTGFSEFSPIFTTKTGLSGCVTMKKDFVDHETTIRDDYGHGTFMTRLIMECSPGCEIIVARVAKNLGDLKNSKDRIRQAILWAGQQGLADIISMSFGFPFEDKGISDAIQTVQQERDGKIIFLASAGNSSSDDESFPARHPSVISVYATDCHGRFLKSNSRHTTRGASTLGTYGDNVPDAICNEIRSEYPDTCKPGSSVATAVMAGISATMLAYARALPTLVEMQGSTARLVHQLLEHLWTKEGMVALLHTLAPENDSSLQRAVQPKWFWQRHPNDGVRCIMICASLADINNKSWKRYS